jgi:hypothetical protein
MNSLERVLAEDLARTVEAIAGSSREGTLAFITAHHPELRTRIEAAESRLTDQRAGLLARYAEWRKGLEEMENLWALAEWEASQPGAADALRAAA